MSYRVKLDTAGELLEDGPLCPVRSQQHGNPIRRDIQFLRGVAVLAVVIYHSGEGVIKHGYLGVDVFFVLSGFLITTLILRGLGSGTFSFRSFYLRRAWRLLPALYSTLLVTALLAGSMLTPAHMADFIEQFIGAITFSANLVLPTQIGYFSEDAANKPLLHIWSLSLEEQYYFFLPLFLSLLNKKMRLAGLVVLMLLSLAWCLSWVTSSGAPPFLWRFGDAQVNEWAFFLFPTRAWELLAGSVCAWVMLQYRGFRVPSVVKWLSLIAILSVSIWGLDPLHPRGNALAVVIASAILVLGDDTWLPQYTPFRFVERIGDWSYSVYLVHWPLFVFAYLGYVEQVPSGVSLMLVFVSIALGYLQYRYVETPFRYHPDHPSGHRWQRIAIVSVVVLTAPLALIGQTAMGKSGPDEIGEQRQINYGLSRNCEGSFEDQKLKPDCLVGDTPRVAVWGDSFAMHLVPGLVRANPDLVQLTKSTCGPFVGLSPIFNQYNKDWAKECFQHNLHSLNGSS